MVEELLETLVRVVDAQLLKSVVLRKKTIQNNCTPLRPSKKRKKKEENVLVIWFQADTAAELITDIVIVWTEHVLTGAEFNRLAATQGATSRYISNFTNIAA